MAIDKIFKNSNVDDLADNVLNEVDDFMVSVDKMQQRKVAGNVQRVVQAFKQIETNISEKFDNVSNVLEKRVLTIKDGRDGATGINGRDGKDGRNGKDGLNGKPGLQGPPGKDGIDGNDGVSVTNANIDFDGSLIINLSSGQQINAGEVVSPELEKQIIAITRGGGSSGSVGDVTGPASASDNRIARFDGTTGKLIQSSPVTLGDGGNMSNIGTIGATGLATLSGGAVIEGLTVGKGAGAISDNTAIGATALNANTTGFSNVANGYLALNANQTGNFNTGVGAYAIGNTVSGGGNTAVGYIALANVTGSNNTAIGPSAGQSVTTGSNNVIIGAYTGFSAPISATGSNYIVLSDGAGTVRQTIDPSGNVSFTGGIASRVVVIADATSITVNADTTDVATQANTQAVGTLTINAPTGTPVNGQKFILRLRSTNVQTFAWNAVFAGSTDIALPISSSGATLHDYVGFIYNSTTSKWQMIAKVFGF
jgi:Collagen triple helix repeat (20 copies)